MLHHLLTNFEVVKYYKNISKFNSVHSWNYLPHDKLRDGSCIINLDYKSTRTHWTALYVNGNTVRYFDNFRVEYIPKEI